MVISLTEVRLWSGIFMGWSHVIFYWRCWCFLTRWGSMCIVGIVVIVVVIISIKTMLIILTWLYFATITFFTETKIEVVALYTDPVLVGMVCGVGWCWVGRVGKVVIDRRDGFHILFCYSKRNIKDYSNDCFLFTIENTYIIMENMSGLKLFTWDSQCRIT